MLIAPPCDLLDATDRSGRGDRALLICRIPAQRPSSAASSASRAAVDSPRGAGAPQRRLGEAPARPYGSASRVCFPSHRTVLRCGDERSVCRGVPTLSARQAQSSVEISLLDGAANPSAARRKHTVRRAERSKSGTRASGLTAHPYILHVLLERSLRRSCSSTNTSMITRADHLRIRSTRRTSHTVDQPSRSPERAPCMHRVAPRNRRSLMVCEAIVHGVGATPPVRGCDRASWPR